jgi:integrase
MSNTAYAPGGPKTATELKTLQNLTPALWFEFVEARLAANVQPVTINTALSCLQTFLRFCQEADQPICQRTLLVRPLKEYRRIPKDAPVEQLRCLGETIAAAVAGAQGTLRRQAIMDQAWFLLMLHSGLRSGEVRRLKLGDLDWENRRARIEQSKGLKDRFVYLSEAALRALKVYLAAQCVHPSAPAARPALPRDPAQKLRENQRDPHHRASIAP